MSKAQKATSAGRGCEEEPADRLQRFLTKLERMTPEQRIEGLRRSFTRWERGVYIGRYPDEVPRLNGQVEWVGASLE